MSEDILDSLSELRGYLASNHGIARGKAIIILRDASDEISKLRGLLRDAPEVCVWEAHTSHDKSYWVSGCSNKTWVQRGIFCPDCRAPTREEKQK